jgi:hypothetical protein
MMRQGAQQESLSSMADVERVKTDFENGSAEEADSLGFGFWAKTAGALLLGFAVLFVILFIFTRAVYAWGSLAGFAFLVAVVLVGAWLHDRRDIRRAEETLKG